MPSNSDAKLRLFAGVELSDETLAALAELQDTLKRDLAPLPLRWVGSEKLHLTLAFYGSVEPGQAEPLKESLRQAAKEISPMVLRFSGLGCFPTPRKPRVLWAGVQSKPEGAIARAICITRAATLHFMDKEDTSEPVPHVTLARVSKRLSANWTKAFGQALADHGELVAAVSQIGHVSLFRSHLDSGRYEVLDRFELAEVTRS